MSDGKAAFIHGNRGRKPSTSFSDETKSMIINLYKNHYLDANFKFFCEILLEDYGISISSTTLNNWLREEFIISPKARRKTKKNLKTMIQQKLNISTSKAQTNLLIESLDTIDDSLAHPRRERCKYIGELIQMDASEFFWLPCVK